MERMTIQTLRNTILSQPYTLRHLPMNASIVLQMQMTKRIK